MKLLFSVLRWTVPVLLETDLTVKGLNTNAVTLKYSLGFYFVESRRFIAQNKRTVLDGLAQLL